MGCACRMRVQLAERPHLSAPQWVPGFPGTTTLYGPTLGTGPASECGATMEGTTSKGVTSLADYAAVVWLPTRSGSASM